MADMLATTGDLDSLLGLGGTIDTARATILIEMGTAVVQGAAGGQRIVQVSGESITLLGTSDSWLDLPQIPVTTVTSVSQDGTALTVGTDYKVFGNRLWRQQGWQANVGWPIDWTWSGWTTVPPSTATGLGQEPSSIAVVYTHGYAAGAQQLQLGRGTVLGMAASAYPNPSGVKSEKIDDYAVTYAQMEAAVAEDTPLGRALRRAYGRRGGLARIG